MVGPGRFFWTSATAFFYPWDSIQAGASSQVSSLLFCFHQVFAAPICPNGKCFSGTNPGIKTTTTPAPSPNSYKRLYRKHRIAFQIKPARIQLLSCCGVLPPDILCKAILPSDKLFFPTIPFRSKSTVQVMCAWNDIIIHIRKAATNFFMGLLQIKHQEKEYNTYYDLDQSLFTYILCWVIQFLRVKYTLSKIKLKWQLCFTFCLTSCKEIHASDFRKTLLIN